jgi:hypothetical protein
MLDEVHNLECALEELSRARAAEEKAVSETQSVRTKLHSAVRKGKAIELERVSLAKRLQALTDAQYLQNPQVHPIMPQQFVHGVKAQGLATGDETSQA